MKLIILAANHCDNVLTQFQEFLQNECKSDLFRLKSHLIERNIGLTSFFMYCLDIQKYKDLSYVVKINLTLSHGESKYKRGNNCSKEDRW